MSGRKAVLALEDGYVLEGRSFGSEAGHTGEVVFNTALCGYQEVLTDPSYAGQIVVMTYPHIGNYGVNLEDVESQKPQVAGFVVREVSPVASSWRSAGDLHGYLAQSGVPGISEVDTRALTRHLRTHGAMRGVISSETGRTREELIALARASRDMNGLDLAIEVTCTEPYHTEDPVLSPAGSRPRAEGTEDPVIGSHPFKVVAYDFGMKRNILRMMANAGCDVTVVPATMPADEVLKLDPEGIFFSNGPGDPAACTYAVEAGKRLIGQRPIFGICLGHQILGLACGGKTFKLKFGHRGANHPVKNLLTTQVEVTSQNHGFAVDPQLFERPEYELTHVNLNDGTVEGFRHKDVPLSSVQYHPEASPGPHDSHYLFADFVQMMERWRRSRQER